jgi:hypothetical protein
MADLAAWGKLLDSDPPQARPTIVKTLSHWRQDTDLAKLPEAERKAWEALWAEVDVLLARASAG